MRPFSTVSHNTRCTLRIGWQLIHEVWSAMQPFGTLSTDSLSFWGSAAEFAGLERCFDLSRAGRKKEQSERDER